MTDPKLIHEALKYHFGFDTFKETSSEIIRNLLDGRNVFVLICPREVANLSVTSCLP